jgi:hypothetical protein
MTCGIDTTPKFELIEDPASIAGCSWKSQSGSVIYNSMNYRTPDDPVVTGQLICKVASPQVAAGGFAAIPADVTDTPVFPCHLWQGTPGFKLVRAHNLPSAAQH